MKRGRENEIRENREGLEKDHKVINRQRDTENIRRRQTRIQGSSEELSTAKKRSAAWTWESLNLKAEERTGLGLAQRPATEGDREHNKP